MVSNLFIITIYTYRF